MGDDLDTKRAWVVWLSSTRLFGKMCHNYGTPGEGRVPRLDRLLDSMVPHCFGVLGEAVRVSSQPSIATACPKADKQWHVQRDGKPQTGPPRLTF